MTKHNAIGLVAKYNEARQKFDSLKGIMTPIRAIKMSKTHSYNTLAQEIQDYEKVILSAITLSNKNFGKRITTVGYFAAVKDAEGVIQIGWSVCVPQDHQGFSPIFGKMIAIQRCLSFKKKEPVDSTQTSFIRTGLINSKNWSRSFFISNEFYSPTSFYYFGEMTLFNQFTEFHSRCFNYFKPDTGLKI